MNQQPPSPPLVVLSLTKCLVAMNAHTGQRVWEHETPHYGGRLFVHEGNVIYCLGADVTCLDYLTGVLRWKAKLPSPISTSPIHLLFAGCLIVQGLGEAACFNAQTGALLWHDGFKGYGQGSGPMAAPGVATQLDRGN